MPASAHLVSVGRWWRAVPESLADEIRGAATGIRALAEDGSAPWADHVADWLDAVANGEPTSGFPLKVARAYHGQAQADSLRVRVHQYLKAHPDLSAWETAAALKEDGPTVRNLLYAMHTDGEAEPDTTGPVTRWKAT